MIADDTAVRRPVGDGQVLLEFDSLPSTMDVARLALLAEDRSVVGVRAGHQTRGRGRRGAPWVEAPRTCLLVTYLLRLDLSPDAARLAFAAGAAVAEAVERITGLVPGLKWPNDVLLNDRKVAGVLVEAHGRDALVGVGLNVNIETFPPGLVGVATSLRIETGQVWNLEVVEEAVRNRLSDLQSARWPSVLQRWRRFDQTAGRRYLAVVGGAEIASTAVGVSDSGALLVRTPSGEVQAVISATSAP